MRLLAQMRQQGRHLFSDFDDKTWPKLLEELLNRKNFNFQRQLQVRVPVAQGSLASHAGRWPQYRCSVMAGIPQPSAQNGALDYFLDCGKREVRKGREESIRRCPEGACKVEERKRATELPGTTRHSKVVQHRALDTTAPKVEVAKEENRVPKVVAAAKVHHRLTPQVASELSTPFRKRMVALTSMQKTQASQVFATGSRKVFAKTRRPVVVNTAVSAAESRGFRTTTAGALKTSFPSSEWSMCLLTLQRLWCFRCLQQ